MWVIPEVLDFESVVEVTNERLNVVIRHGNVCRMDKILEMT